LPSRREWLQIVLLGVSGIFLYNFFFLYGLQHITAGRGALVVALNPVMVAVVAWTFTRERVTMLKGLGAVVAFLGCLLVITDGNPAALWRGEVGVGEWLVFGCVVCWTIYTFVGRAATKTLSPLIATAYGCIIGWLMLLTALLLRDTVTLALLTPHFSARAWSSILFLGIFGTTLGFTWYNDGVRRIGAARAAAFINLVPVAAVLLGALLLDERLGLPVLAGGAMILLGVWLTNRTRTA
jgi:drug/metabolite transporter (DMT)-like permease